MLWGESQQRSSGAAGGRGRGRGDPRGRVARGRTSTPDAGGKPSVAVAVLPVDAVDAALVEMRRPRLSTDDGRGASGVGVGSG